MVTPKKPASWKIAGPGFTPELREAVRGAAWARGQTISAFTVAALRERVAATPASSAAPGAAPPQVDVLLAAVAELVGAVRELTTALTPTAPASRLGNVRTPAPLRPRARQV